MQDPLLGDPLETGGAEARNVPRLLIAWLWRIRTHLLVWVTFVAYVVAYNALYSRFFPSVGRTLSIAPIGLTETTMLSSIEKVERVRRGGQEVYVFSGWAFPEDGQRSTWGYHKHLVLLAESGNAYIYDALTRERMDVAGAFPNHEGDESSSGFMSYVSPFSLRTGDYRIGLLYTREDGSSIYALTRWFVRRTANTIRLTPFRPSAPDPLGELLLRVGVGRWLQPLPNVSCGIDWLRVAEPDAEGVYKLSGWCFPESADLALDRMHRHIMLIDSSSRLVLLNVRTVIRPDLTDAFSELHRDLDLSGFSVDIPVKRLEEGLYRLGIAWTDRLSASVYSLTYFYIERTPSGLQLVHSPLTDVSLGAGLNRWRDPPASPLPPTVDPARRPVDSMEDLATSSPWIQR
jgi:hypothetical protein